MDTVLYMSFGAALVSLGAIVFAVATRIRGGHEARTLVQRVPLLPSSDQQVTRERAAFERWQRVIPKGGKVAADTSSAEIVEFLIGSGYPKAIAIKAVTVCDAHERETPESWLAAALRHAIEDAPQK